MPQTRAQGEYSEVIIIHSKFRKNLLTTLLAILILDRNKHTA